MKKVLAILASLGLVATSTITVIACATETNDNANYSFNDVKNWFEKAQPNADKKEEGKTMLIAIGGRHNSDTLSYLATLNWLVANDHTQNAENLIKQENIVKNDEMLSAFKISDKKTDWSTAVSTIINAVNSNDATNDENQVSVIAKDYFYHDINTQIKEMTFKTILVDNIENFWTTSLGNDIVKKIIATQLKDLIDFAGDNDNFAPDPDLNELFKDKEKYEKFIEKKTKKLVNEFTKNQTNTGPWFLVVRSGKIVGIKTGFRNYYDFNPEYKEADKKDNQITKELAVKTLNEFGESIAKSLVDGIDWLMNNFLTTSEDIVADKLIKKNEPTTTTNSAWLNKISGTSNVEDLKKPRGEDSKPDDGDKDGENPTEPDGEEPAATDPETNPESLKYTYNELDWAKY